jgi:uncharacterized protein (DUF952 family)
VHTYVYKIFRLPEWQSFTAQKIFAGSVHDQLDGFIHLCAAVQLAGTLAKHYTDEESVVLARFDADNLEALKWEISRGGEDFPHLYASLLFADVAAHCQLMRTSSPCFEIPGTFLKGLL